MRVERAVLLLWVCGLVLLGCEGGSGRGGVGSSTGAGSRASPPSPAPPLARLTPRAGWFEDPQGRVVFLRGANYSNRSKSTPQVGWQREAHFEQLRAWGFNCVRLLLQWNLLEPQPGQLDQAYLDHVEEVLDWAERQELYVVLDMHQDLFAGVFGGDGAPAWATVDHLVTPNQLLQPWWMTYFTTEVQASFDRLHRDRALQDHLARAWAAVARRARGRAHVLGYDLFNEPFQGTGLPWEVERGPLSDLYARLGGAILAEDPHAVLFVEPIAATSNFGAPTSLRPTTLRLPSGAPVVYAPHVYDPLLLAGRPYGGPLPVDWTVGLHVGEARRFGVPLFVGELGVPRGHPAAATALEDQCRLLERYLVPGWTVWNHNPDPTTNTTIEPAEMYLSAHGSDHPGLRALLRPYPRAAAGIPRAMSFDPGSATFRLELEAPPTGLPTVVHLPAWAYPTVRVLAPGRWSFDPGRRELSYWAKGLPRETLVVTP